MEKIYEFVAVLNDFKPRVYRRFLIGENSSVQDLMDTLMVLFGMDGYHLYDITQSLKGNKSFAHYYEKGIEFQMFLGRNSCSRLFHLSIDERIALIPDELDREMDMNYRNIKISDIKSSLHTLQLNAGKSITFSYDYGDDWQINIKLDKILESDKKYKGYPYVKSGKGQGIIEDIGGTYGLYETVKEDLEDFMEFDKGDINNYLEDIFSQNIF